MEIILGHGNILKNIPTIIINTLSNKIIPIYGDGKNIRDWIYVEDHINALFLVALNGKLEKVIVLVQIRENKHTNC